MTSERHDVFISYASEDRDSFVRPLAEALQRRGVRVWYDAFSLAPGDSVSAKIDAGLSGCRFGVLVLSKAFFNKKWPEKEYRALLQRAQREGRDLLIPIYYGVTNTEVATYSKLLADIYAITDVLEVDWVAERIVETIQFRDEEAKRGPIAVNPHVEPPVVRNSGPRRPPKQDHPQVYFGFTLDKAFGPYFGSSGAPNDVPQVTHPFDGRDNERLREIVNKIPGDTELRLVELGRDVGFDDGPDATRDSFYKSRSAIHISTDGVFGLRFPQRGAHILYDIYTTIGAAYTIARDMARQYDMSPAYHFTFGYRLGDDTFPKDFVEGSHLEALPFDANVLDTFGDSVADVVIELVRNGNVVRGITREEIVRDANEFWNEHFPGC